jgi:GT2 family glycosyltransferase/SAM-dependent methyltransferase
MLDQPEEKQLFVIIATNNRPSLLERALGSIAAQTKLPTKVLVVADSSSQLAQSITDSALSNSPAEIGWLVNTRTKNLSGALNTALIHLLSMVTFPQNAYVAFLDDDDEWDASYLNRCLETATKNDADIVVSGLIRHEFSEDPGRRQKIPDALSSSSFLVANPHVQGSNLFVRLAALLRAGGFDENLESTTDRDMCIRLFDLGDLKVAYVNGFLVHHWATGLSRLSTPGSAKKRAGLATFYRKYAPRMSELEKERFLHRAQEKFGCQKEDFDTGLSERQQISIPTCEPNSPIDLVVGFTATNLESTRLLLEDLSEIFPAFEGKKHLCVCDNSGDASQLELMLKSMGTDIVTTFLSRERILQDASNGKFGSWFVPAERQSGIGFGRTALHSYLYLECASLGNPVVWVLDDDVRLDTLRWANSESPLTPHSFIRLLSWMISERYSIAIGKVVGDAPLPTGSTVRTQLLDFTFNLRALTNDSRPGDPSQMQIENNSLMEKLPDYYYDLSLRHGQHLETPFWHPKACTSPERRMILRTLFQEFPLILKGVNVFRPVKYTSDRTETSEGGIPMRGGNTLIFDIECLRVFPNLAPRIDGTDVRRGDTLWSILNHRIRGTNVSDREQRVVSVPLLVRQDRRHSPDGVPSVEKISADIYGSAMVRSLDNILEKRRNALPANASADDVLRLSPTEVDEASATFEALVKNRSDLLLMNSWRIQGLVRGIRSFLEELRGRGDGMGELVSPWLPRVFETLAIVEQSFHPQRTSELLAMWKVSPRKEFAEFLEDLRESCSSFRKELSVIPTAANIACARSFLQSEFGLEKVDLIGWGNEGLLFSDGKKAYKHFHAGIYHFGASQLEFLEKALAPERHLRHIVAVERVTIQNGRVVFTTPLVSGEEYHGGHLLQMLAMLRECKEQRIAIKNLSPSNLIVDNSELRFVDAGIDVCPFHPDIFRQMCKRAYLTYRYHFRSDLKQLMARSLRDESLPELFGFEHFIAALEAKDPHEALDDATTRFVSQQRIQWVLDYGCGKGTLAVKLANPGKRIAAYDPDTAGFQTTREHTKEVQFVGEDGLRLYLTTSQAFDCVVCNLVLCTIPDDAEVVKVLDNCRRLVASNGFILLGICNSFNLSVMESETHVKELDGKENYENKFVYEKLNKKTGRRRWDVHRPFSWYEMAIRKVGFSVDEIVEIPSTDVLRLCPASDFLLLKLLPIPVQDSSVSLLMKVSAMEWRTVRFQIRHIVKQLETPRRFLEKIVVTDSCEGPFAHQYESGSFARLHQELEGLILEGVIDRIVVAPTDTESVREIGLRWFNLHPASQKSDNGQPTLTSLYGFEQCRGKFILQVDGDLLICRDDPTHDFLGEMLDVLNHDPDAISVGFPVGGDQAKPFTVHGDKGKWRTNVRCCLVSKKRLEQLRPLPNSLNDKGVLESPWHRSVDSAMKDSKWQNYRGGNPKTFYVHIPNERKNDRNGWFSTVKAVERRRINHAQRGNDQLAGEFWDWIGKRTESLVFIVRGRNVPASKLRRCLNSLLMQSDQDFGVIAIDAESKNAMEEFLETIFRRKLGSRLTLYHNLDPAPSSENIHTAITKLCSNPSSIIVELDADDALIGADVVRLLKQLYTEGADATVGSMLRTDKTAEYPVSFENPRRNRGGNVWQHLRSFRKYLFDRIDPNDLKINGEWIAHNVDWAYMLPIIEMAERPVHIKTPIYFYEPTGKSLLTVEARKRVIGEIVRKRPYNGLQVKEAPSIVAPSANQASS